MNCVSTSNVDCDRGSNVMCGRTTSVVDYSGTSSVGSGRLDSVQSCGTTVIHCRKSRLIFRDIPRSVDDL